MDKRVPSEALVLKRLIGRRYSCRGFLPQAVNPATISELLTMAQRTASWCNSQPWQLVITGGEETERFRRALREGFDAERETRPDFPFPTEYRGVYQERRRACAAQLYDSVGVTPGDRVAAARQTAKNFSLFGAPHVAIVHTPAALGTYGAVDCGGYIANFMLAARSLGVACVAQAALALHAPLIRSYFDIPDDRLILCGVSFGYEDPEAPANGFRTDRAAHDVARILV